VPAGQPQWLFVATRNPRSHPFDTLLPALLVGFAVFLAGGMLLLWQVQRPLKRLGVALEAVGQSQRVGRLPVAGAGEARVLAERYNDMVERLHEHEEDRATMLAGVAHDLRSPITRLRLLMELESGSRAADMLHNVDDIERITEQFLVYARRNDEEPLEDHDLGLFAEEVAAPFGPRGVTVVGEANDVVVPIRANALRRALINLIENALEYGSAPVTVRVSRAGGAASIAVEDAGQGIAAELMPRALRPFARLDSSRGGKGHCGLGLVIAARIAEAHGGELRLSNRDGGGLVAEIRLPLAAPAALAA
jgi:two-component system osmolarity sensor histidine kinase EnvZ